jgi:anti-sigma factor RsiW
MDGDKIDGNLLSAWLDGELAAAERVRIEAWLDGHPDEAARVRQWAADAAALRAALAPVADEPVPDALQRVVWRRSGTPPWALAASAAGLLLLGGLIGGGLVWQGLERGSAVMGAQPAARTAGAANSAAGWVERAAYAHSLYTVEPLHAVEVKAQEEHLSRWLTSRIQLPVKLFNLRDQGFSLVGGRLLPDGPGKSAQLMYENAAKQRVTVYLRKPEAGADAAFRYEQHGDLGLFYWVESGLGYALVGALPREQLLALADDIYKQNPVVDPKVPAAASAPAH